MSGKAIMRLDTSVYEEPTQEDFDEAKAFVRERNNYASLLESLIMEILRNAAREITIICYKYNIDPIAFTLQSNDSMYGEIVEVMERVEEEIMQLIQQYSAINAGDDRDSIIAYIMSLGRQNRNLTDTLEDYLWRYLYDIEALIASMQIAGHDVATATTKIVGALQSVYTTPEVRSAMSVPGIAAMYLKSKGIHYDPGTQHPSVGLSNNGAVNVTNMAKITLLMAWRRENLMAMEAEGVAGYYVMRGSSYDCKMCDSNVGFHNIDDKEHFPPIHPHCCCIAVPINKIIEE